MSEKKKSKKGFTLVEVIVALACSTIVLSTIVGSFIFMKKMNTELMNRTGNLYKLRIVRTYINKNYVEGMTFTYDDGTIMCGDEVVVKNSLIYNISFEKDSYTICRIMYNENSNKEYKFIVDRG